MIDLINAVRGPKVCAWCEIRHTKWDAFLDSRFMGFMFSIPGVMRVHSWYWSWSGGPGQWWHRRFHTRA